MKITFFTLDKEAGTAWLRAGMIAHYLNFENKRKSQWVSLQELKNSPDIVVDNFIKSLGKDDCVVFVKTLYEEDLVKQIRDRCGLVILDPSDDTRIKERLYWKDLVDGVLYDTDYQKTQLELLGYKNPLEVKHLHSNFDSNFKQIRKLQSPIHIVGYLGLTQQFDNLEDAVKKITNVGLGWYQASPNPKTNNIHTTRLDCQIVHVNKTENREYALKTKPHNKLINCLSFGIPTIYSPYDSYLKAVKSYPTLEWLCDESLDNKIKKLLMMIFDQNLHKKACDESFDLSRRYHVSNYQNCYEGMFQLIDSR